MTKANCDVTLERFKWGGTEQAKVTRKVCGHSRVYDLTFLRAIGQRAELPPCTCPPMVEPFEMI